MRTEPTVKQKRRWSLLCQALFAPSLAEQQAALLKLTRDHGQDAGCLLETVAQLKRRSSKKGQPTYFM